MSDFVIVQVLEGVSHLLEPEKDLTLRETERVFFNHLTEILSFNVIHKEETLRIILRLCAKDFNKARVVKSLNSFKSCLISLINLIEFLKQNLLASHEILKQNSALSLISLNNFLLGVGWVPLIFIRKAVRRVKSFNVAILNGSLKIVLLHIANLSCQGQLVFLRIDSCL